MSVHSKTGMSRFSLLITVSFELSKIYSLRIIEIDNIAALTVLLTKHRNWCSVLLYSYGLVNRHGDIGNFVFAFVDYVYWPTFSNEQ